MPRILALLALLSPLWANAEDTRPSETDTATVNPAVLAVKTGPTTPGDDSAIATRPLPVVQVLALDRILPGATEDKLKALLPEEARQALNLYLGGHLRQWYFRQDRPGAIFVLEVNSLDEARQLLAGLPLVRAGLVDYDLVPIGPYIPLATLPPAPRTETPPPRKRRR